MLRGHAVQSNMLDPDQVLTSGQRTGQLEGELVDVERVPVDVSAADRGRNLVDLGPLAGAVVGGGGGGGARDVHEERANVESWMD